MRAQFSLRAPVLIQIVKEPRDRASCEDTPGADLFDVRLTGYVLDSSGYGLAAFGVAGALGPSSRLQQRDEGVPRRPGGPPHLGCCRSNYLSQAHIQRVQ